MILVHIFSLVILFIVGGVWRRLFGGWLSRMPVIRERVIQHLLGGCILFSLFYFIGLWEWYYSVLYSVLIQGVFWAPGHGMWFDIGRQNSGTFTQTDFNRYRKSLGYKIARFILPHKYTYGYFFDFVGMTLRYTIPSLLMIFVMPKFIWVGLSAGVVYDFCHNLFEREADNLKRTPFIGNPTNLAEFLYGGLVYSSIYYLLII